MFCLKFIAGEHGMFKVLSQPDDFNDDLGIPLDDLAIAVGKNSDGSSVNDL